MKVANVFFEDRYGGPQKRAIQVARRIMERGVSTVVVLPEGQGNAAEVAEKEGVPMVRLPFCRTPRLSKLFRVIQWAFLLPVDILRFSSCFRKERPDVVHVNGAFFLAPAFAAKLSRIPLVWHLNDTIVPKPLARILGWLVKQMANVIVVAASAVARHYNIPEGSYEVIFAPVDVDKIQKINNEGGSNGVGRIGLLANWSPIKGVEYFVQAAALLHGKYAIPVQAVFAGQRMSNVDYCQSVEQMIDETGLRPHVLDLGFVSQAEDFLSRIDVLVMSSTTEACPMSVLEAMAAGIPVVATDVGGARELLLDGEHKAGMIVPVKDASAIADALTEILQSPDVSKQMGSNGRRFAENRFSLDICVSRHLSVYGRACGRQLEAS